MAESLATGALILEAVRSGTAPRAAQLAAARGALPLAPAQLLQLQLILVASEDGEIAQAARESLDAVNADAARGIVADRDAAPDALTFLALKCGEWPDVAMELASSTRLPPESLRPVARCAFPDALAALVANDAAVSADPELGRLLWANPSLPGAARIRLQDYLEELAKEQAAPAAPAVAPAPARDEFLAALGVDAEVEALLPELGLDLGELQERSDLLGDPADDDEARLYSRIARLNVGQKLRLALFGSREERTILLRDSNRIVAAAVIKNPKFTEQEAEAAANSRNVAVEILRRVGQHREFAKVYQVQKNLVCNPRCPPNVSAPFIGNLTERDLRLLLKNRNVPDAVRLQARKILDVRAQRQKVRFSTGRH